MNHTLSHVRLIAIAGIATVMVAVVVLGTPREASAELIRHTTSGAPYSGYFVQPGGGSSVGAKMYPCPRPAPPLVGHTYITYEPLNPHEMLYRHSRVYRTSHDDAPPTRTKVRWGTSGAPLSRLLSPPVTDTTFKSHIVR